MLGCWTIICGLAPRIPLRRLVRHLHRTSHAHTPIGQHVVHSAVRHATQLAAKSPLPTPWVQLVCKQIAPGLAGLGLVALGPAAVPQRVPAFGPGGMGGVPGGFVSEYGGPAGTGSGSADAGTGLPSSYDITPPGGSATSSALLTAAEASAEFPETSGGNSAQPAAMEAGTSPPRAIAGRETAAPTCSEMPSGPGGRSAPCNTPDNGTGRTVPIGSNAPPVSTPTQSAAIDEPPSLLIVAAGVLFTAMLNRRRPIRQHA